MKQNEYVWYQIKGTYSLKKCMCCQLRGKKGQKVAGIYLIHLLLYTKPLNNHSVPHYLLKMNSSVTTLTPLHLNWRSPLPKIVVVRPLDNSDKGCKVVRTRAVVLYLHIDWSNVELSNIPEIRKKNAFA